MKRTGAGTLTAVGFLAVVAGFILDQLLVASGSPTYTPPIVLAALLVLFGVVVVMLALPVRRALRSTSRVHIDPFRALRVAMLAKASSIVGVAVAGFALGLLLFAATRPVSPPASALTAIISTAVGALALAAAALVAEHWCTIGKDDDDDQPAPGDEPGLGLSHHD